MLIKHLESRRPFLQLLAVWMNCILTCCHKHWLYYWCFEAEVREGKWCFLVFTVEEMGGHERWKGNLLLLPVNFLGCVCVFLNCSDLGHMQVQSWGSNLGLGTLQEHQGLGLALGHWPQNTDFNNAIELCSGQTVLVWSSELCDLPKYSSLKTNWEIEKRGGLLWFFMIMTFFAEAKIKTTNSHS